MTIGILLLMAVLLALLAFYILHWLKHFLPRDGQKRRAPLLFCVLAVLAALISICIFTTPGLILFHFWILSMIAEPVVWMFRSKMKKRFFHVLRIGIPGLVTALLVLWGAYNISHPVQTDYTLFTEKAIRPEGYRVVLLTDLHYDTVQPPEVLGRYIRRIQETRPDLVILGGDIVEEGTSKAQMEEAFRALSALESTYGTYYVYGNHDRQNYSRSPAYTPAELVQAMEDCGITILQDNAVNITEDLVLAGREDAAWGGHAPRASSEAILAGADKNALILMVDHQPIGWEENALAGVDVQLSGHTHAGQIWPVGEMLEIFGNLSYGHYDKGCQVYVSSGFAGWGYPLRTSERSEYVVLNILPAQE